MAIAKKTKSVSVPKLRRNSFEYHLLTPQCTTILEKGKTVIMAFGFCIVWILIATFILNSMPKPQWHFPFTIGVTFPVDVDKFDGYKFIHACIFAPIVEEIIFRIAPIQILKRTKLLIPIGFPVILLTSAIFGWMHGDSMNVMTQGVGGMVFAWVYIRNNYCFVSGMATHFLWNAFLIVGLPYLMAS